MKAYIKRHRPIPPEIVQEYFSIPKQAEAQREALKRQIAQSKVSEIQAYAHRYIKSFSFTAKVRDIAPYALLPTPQYHYTEDKFTSDNVIAYVCERLHLSEDFDELIADSLALGVYVTQHMETFLTPSRYLRKPKNYPSKYILQGIVGCFLLAFGLIMKESEHALSNSSIPYYAEFLAYKGRYPFKKAQKALKNVPKL